MYVFESKVKDWYKETYPNDAEIAIALNEDVTFFDVFDCLQTGHGRDLYDIIGVADSLVRERIFDKIVELLGGLVTYDDLYVAWLGEKKIIFICSDD